MKTAESDSQERALKAFTFLHHHRADWRGRVILSIGLGTEGSAIALAANIAGAVCLSLEADRVLHHNALRSASSDFAVNTLDEALRAMKNEVRKHRPISVALLGEIPGVVQEIVERGLVPDLLVNSMDASVDPANMRWMRSMNTAITTSSTIQKDANAFAADHLWTMYSFSASDHQALRSIDSAAAALLEQESAGSLRQRWLRAAPGIIQRERPLHRFLWLTAEERNRFVAS